MTTIETFISVLLNIVNTPRLHAATTTISVFNIVPTVIVIFIFMIDRTME